MFVPRSRPKITKEKLLARIEYMGFDVSNEKSFVVGVRGYYGDSGGKPGVNDRGIYDDALFIIGNDGTFVGFNGNTDPSAYRKGRGTAEATKGMASLKPGMYRSHQLGLHRGKYMALIQTGGMVTVIRDGTPDYEDTGWFGINIHKGGYDTTSSLGCQTVHPDQWAGFINIVQTLMHANHQAVMPYVLLEFNA